MMLYVRKCLALEVGLNPAECYTMTGLRRHVPVIRKWFRDNYSNKYTRESFDYYVRIVMPILKATEGRRCEVCEGCEGKDAKGRMWRRAGAKGKGVKGEVITISGVYSKHFEYIERIKGILNINK